MDDQEPQANSFTESGGNPAPRRHSVHGGRRTKLFKKIMIFTGVLLLAVLFVLGSGKVFKKRPAINQPATQTNAPSKPRELPVDVPSNPTLTAYSNTVLNLTLTYPGTWKLTQTADNGVRIESPVFRYVAFKGTIDGYFRLYIRKGARSSDGAYIGHGIAIEPSQK